MVEFGKPDKPLPAAGEGVVQQSLDKAPRAVPKVEPKPVEPTKPQFLSNIERQNAKRERYQRGDY